jgi:hypothetical protein
VFFGECAALARECFQDPDGLGSLTHRNGGDGAESELPANFLIRTIVFAGVVAPQRVSGAQALAGDTGVNAEAGTERRSHITTSTQADNNLVAPHGNGGSTRLSKALRSFGDRTENHINVLRAGDEVP